MPKTVQALTNPYPHSDSNKRYYTYDYYLRLTYGGKCAKIPLDIGLSCPNIDGHCAVGGCIFCSGRGSGDFAPPPTLSIREQFDATQAALTGKWRTERCIPYFQAHTNTYAPIDVLRPLYEEALALPGAVGLNIATRADCLPDEVLALLDALSHRTHLTVELGLQTSHNDTAARINRGHTWEDFVEGYARLRAAVPHAEVCVHLILGLPGEDGERMRQTACAVAALRPHQVKLHLLHVLRGTVLGEMYEAGLYAPLSQEDYVRAVVETLERLPPDTVIARLTGDGAGEALLAPDWSRRKLAVINAIDKRMVAENTYQGRLYG